MTGTTWPELFQALVYGDGAIIGLILVALVGIVAISKMKEAAVIFTPVSLILCLQVLANDTGTFATYAGIGYGILAFLFILIGVAGKHSAF